MSWVAAAIGGGALLGLGGSMMAADSQSDAIESAARTQKDGQMYAADIQKEMYDKQSSLQQPFLQTGYSGNSMLQSLLAGQPVTGYDPSWRQLSNQELAKIDPNFRPTTPYYTNDTYEDGRLVTRVGADRPKITTQVPTAAQLPTAGEIPTLANLPSYDNVVGQQKLPGYDSVVGKPDLPKFDNYVTAPTLPNYDEMVTNAQFEESPVYKALMEQGTRNLNRNLASRNLQGGGQAVTSLRDMGTDITAKEYTNQFARNQSRYSAALDQALQKYSQNKERYSAALGEANTSYDRSKERYSGLLGEANTTYDRSKERYAGLLDSSLNQYNAELKTYGIKTDLANSQYGRLTDMLKVGQGAAGSIGAASQNYGNSAANTAMEGANNLANAQLAQGQNKANLYSSIGQLPMQLGGLAIQAKGAKLF